MSTKIKWAELMFEPVLLIKAVVIVDLLKLIFPEQLQNVLITVAAWYKA
jgi:hypothetical protein